MAKDDDKQIDIRSLKMTRELRDPALTEPVNKYSPTAIQRPKTRRYLVEELFFDIEGDPDHIIFKVPEAIAEDLQWKEGDTISIEMLKDRAGFSMKKIK